MLLQLLKYLTKLYEQLYIRGTFFTALKVRALQINNPGY